MMSSRLLAVLLGAALVVGSGYDVYGAKPGKGAKGKAAEAAKGAVPAIDWTKAEEVRPGVRLEKLELSEPQLMKVYVMRIDLKIKGLKVTGTERDARWGEPMPDYVRKGSMPEKCVIRTRREKTVDFINRLRRPKEEGGRGLDVIAAWNSGPWHPWPPPQGNEYADPMFLSVSDGVEIGDNSDPALNAVFAIDGKMKPQVLESVSKPTRKDMLVAHSGFGILMKKGKRLEFHPRSYEGALMPRTAVGYSKDFRYLFVVSIDGRKPGWSDGARGNEVCDILEAAGAWEAIDFDGGGSQTLCYVDEKTGEPVTICRSENRAVGMNMAVYIENKPSKTRK